MVEWGHRAHALWGHRAHALGAHDLPAGVPAAMQLPRLARSRRQIQRSYRCRLHPSCAVAGARVGRPNCVRSPRIWSSKAKFRRLNGAIARAGPKYRLHPPRRRTRSLAWAPHLLLPGSQPEDPPSALPPRGARTTSQTPHRARLDSVAMSAFAPGSSLGLRSRPPPRDP